MRLHDRTEGEENAADGVLGRVHSEQLKRLRRFFDFTVDVYNRFSADAGSFLAATISYYALFSIFPLLLLAISAAGFFLTYRGSSDILSYASQVLPQSIDIVKDNVQSVAGNRQSTGVVGLAVLLWSGTAVFDAIAFSLNKVWKAPASRHFILSKLLSIAGVITVILLLLMTTLLSAGYEAFQDYWLTVFKTTPPLAALQAATAVGGAVFTFLALLIIYAVVPNLKLGLKDVWIGAAASTGALYLAKRLFVVYTSRAARFNAVYGSVGLIVGFLFWLYIIGMILILGAEINAALAAGRSKSTELD